MIQEGVFVEWGKHKGHYYGTRRVQPDQLEPSRRLGRTSTFKVGEVYA